MIDYLRGVSILVLVILGIQALLFLLRYYTDVGIGRLGYFSLRYVTVPLSPGLHLFVGLIGISFHRPRITNPTWVTLKVKNAKLTVRLEELRQARSRTASESKRQTTRISDARLAERLKSVVGQGIVRWIDFMLLDTTIHIEGCGTLQLGHFSFRIEHRHNHDRRLDSINVEDDISAMLGRKTETAQRGLEFFIRSANLRLQVRDQKPFELMDAVIVNAWSEYGGPYSFRNVGLSCKFGKLDFIGDDILEFMQLMRPSGVEQTSKLNPQDYAHLQGTASSHPESFTSLASVFDVFTELQIHAGFLRGSYQTPSITPGGSPVTITISSKDVVFDINRLKTDSPDYRMLFEPGVVAHQALFSLISLAVHMDANHQRKPILSIPMLTIASKTSSIAQMLLPENPDIGRQSTNLTTINTVITSPASDIHSGQIPIILALFRPSFRPTDSTSKSIKFRDKSRLPRIQFAFSIHDPSIRVVLDSIATDGLPPMIIGRLSSVFADANIFHEGEELMTNSSFRLAAGRVYYHSPQNEEFDVMRLDSAQLKLSCFVFPIAHGYISAMIDGFRVHLSKSEIVDCFAKITDTFHAPTIYPKKLSAPRQHQRKLAPLMQVPGWVVEAKVSTKNISISISGPDLEVAPDLRGVKVVLEELIVDYGKSNTVDGALSFPQEFYKGHDLTAFRNDDLNSRGQKPERKVLATLRGLNIFTVDSLFVQDKQHPLLVLPLLEAAFSQTRENKKLLHHIALRAEDVAVGFSIYKVYAILQALQVLRTAFHRKAPTSEGLESDDDPNSRQSGLGIKEETTAADLTFEGKINLIRIKTRLPLNEIQMIEFDHLHIYKQMSGDPQLRLRYARMYVDSPAFPNKWDRIVSIRDIKLSRETYTTRASSQTESSKSLTIRSDAMRIRIPHQFVFYMMLEAIINSMKATTQIIHRFATQTNDYVIAQHIKDARILPRIRIKSRIVTVEVEDDPFEARLGLIFRVGLSEQRMREARENAFDRKVLKLRQQRSGKRRGSTLERVSSARHDTNSVRSSLTKDSSFPDSVLSSENSNHSQSIEDDFSEEREKLLAHSSRAWILRMQLALSFRHRKMREMRQHKWGKDEIGSIPGPEEILEISNRPPLFSVSFSGLDIVLDKPSFPLSHLPEYLYRIGRGLPRDTQYGLLVPLNLNWKMDEARVQVRDYPLPLLHIPPLHASQRTQCRAWEFTSDLVIAEEFPEMEAIRHIDVNVIPANTGRQGSPAFNVEVQRTATSVKTYADMAVDINSGLPTRVHWGTSMQPGISDVMRILDTLSKPQQDPSPKLGFWDKIGLVMHTSVKLSWKHDGDMHITLKGSRDPYVVIGTGAGLTKVFRGNVRWNIGVDADPRKLMEVICDEYMLAISDFSLRDTNVEGPRQAMVDDHMRKKSSLHHYHLSRKEISFQKILMKLTGDVRWTAGLAFERHCVERNCSACDGKAQCRIWDFEPHWHVKMRIPKYSVLPGGKIRDAFEGFRSQYIHGQISVTSRAREDCSESYNTMHLTPKFFAHFFDWIHSFSGNLSLPIRSGPLFPSAEGPKQKFGHHLMTLKYNLQLEPLYLSHVYKSADSSDPGKIDITGVKARIDTFTLDLHQRKEERIVTNKMLETERRSQHMAIYRAQVDLTNTDLRAVTAIFQLDLSEELHRETSVRDPLDPSQSFVKEEVAQNSDFDIPEEDLAWVDLDDFVELDTILPEISPSCQIIPLAYAPRFIYDRDTTHREGNQHDNYLSNVATPGQRFGLEETHFCSMQHVIGAGVDDFGRTQKELWNNRRLDIQKRLRANQDRMRQVELQLRKTANSFALNEEHKNLLDHHQILLDKIQFVDQITSNTGKFFASELDDEKVFESDQAAQELKTGTEFLRHIKAEFKKFNNRFVVHNIQMKWNNTLRNVLIRYIQQVSQRRGFSYYMSQKAVRFLADLVDEQARDRQSHNDQNHPEDHETVADTENGRIQLENEVEQLINQLLEDRESNFYVADESSGPANVDERIHTSPFPDDTKGTQELQEGYTSVNNYIVRLVAPQIQLQSEKNKDSAIILAAQSMQLKIVAINDQSIAEDDVSALVQRKFSVKMSSAQFFYAHQSGFHGAIANLLTQNSYGAAGTSDWPPWVPIEAVYDFQRTPRAFERIVVRTSVLMTYTKNNNLRIRKNDLLSSRNRMIQDVEDRTDSISVHFPKFNLSANSEQYYAMFTIVMDLLMYSEPLQKERNEQIERILLAADFSDLTGAPEMVKTLQSRIRHLNDFKTQFKLHAQRNDPQCKKDEIKVEKALQECEDELFFLMKSIATAQQKREDRDNEVIPAMHWHLKADEILWHLMEKDEAFIDFGLSKASFQRTDNSDSSNHNTLEVEMMQGINLSPDPVFAQLFAPYFGNDRTVVDARRSKMVRVYWYMLEAIGGISVCDHFEVNLFPLRLQMEHDVGKKIFAYVFPDKNKAKKSDSETDSDDEEGTSLSSSSVDDVNGELNESRKSRSYDKKKIHGKLSFDRLRHSASLSRLSHKSSSSHLQPDSASIASRDTDRQSLLNGRGDGLTRTDSITSLPRTGSANTTKPSSLPTKKRNAGSADDLTAMMSRANTNMSLVYVKVPSVVLALSYKGAKAKNFVDVTDFVFKLPTIEYRNKTWSYLDLAEHVKREVIKAVLAHTGSLLKDKMIHYRKSKNRKPTLARQLTSYRTFVPAEESENKIHENDEAAVTRASLDHERDRSRFIVQNRTTSAETASIHEEAGHGLFNNAIGRHIHHLSHLARHKDGLTEDNAESTLKKTRMLLGKFIDKAI